MSLRTRIILTYALLVAASFACLTHLIINDVRPRYLEAVEEATVDIAELLAATLSQQITDGVLHTEAIDAAMVALGKRQFSAQIYDIKKQKVNLQVYITDNKGTLLYDSTGEAQPGADFSQWRDVNLTLRGHYGARSTRTTPSAPASQVIFIAAPILKEGQIFGVVSIGKPTDSVSFFINIARKRFALSLFLVGITAISFAVALSFWITRPVQRLIAYMHSIKQGAPAKLPDLGTSEIGQLGAALNEMQAKLEGKNYIEDYVRALTHEMKSPLTGIKGAGEILRDHISNAQGSKFLDNIESEVDRLQSLVERMLQLSRLENVRTIHKKTIHTQAMLAGLAATFQPQLEKKGITLQIDAHTAKDIMGDELLLRQALENLIANAIDFSPTGSTITVALSVQGQELFIAIQDQGTGIPEFAVTKVFDKFFSLNRPGSGKKSTGLGLPFVKEVITLHNGDIQLTNTQPGLQASIRLPL